MEVLGILPVYFEDIFLGNVVYWMLRILVIFPVYQILLLLFGTLFFHPLRVKVRLTIMDKEYEIEGQLSDISIFFIIIKTKENKKITIPSNVFMQKMIKQGTSG